MQSLNVVKRLSILLLHLSDISTQIDFSYFWFFLFGSFKGNENEKYLSRNQRRWLTWFEKGWISFLSTIQHNYLVDCIEHFTRSRAFFFVKFWNNSNLEFWLFLKLFFSKFLYTILSISAKNYKISASFTLSFLNIY